MVHAFYGARPITCAQSTTIDAGNKRYDLLLPCESDAQRLAVKKAVTERPSLLDDDARAMLAFDVDTALLLHYVSEEDAASTLLE